MKSLLVALALLLPAAALAGPSTGCTYPTTENPLEEVFDGETITASLYNEATSCTNSIQAELGTNPSGSYPTVADRLDGAFVSLAADNAFDCAAAATCKKQTAGVLNGVLYASNYPGADLGARVNAALGQCDSVVGGSRLCEVRLSPAASGVAASYTLSTAIKIDRSLVTLDCGGATIITGSSFHDVAVRINAPTIGTVGSSDLTHVTVKNCFFSASSQTDVSDWDGGSPPGTMTDQRSGFVTVHRVDGIVLQNLQFYSVPTTALWVSNSIGSVSDIKVDTTRRSWAAKDADGLFLAGGTVGTPVGGIVASNIVVDNTVASGIRANNRVSMSSVFVSNAEESCIAIRGMSQSNGVGDPDSGGSQVALSTFQLRNCNTADYASTDVAAIEIADAAYAVTISGGNIADTDGGGIYIDGAQNVRLDALSLVCWGDRSGTGGLNGIEIVGSNTRSVSLSDSYLSPDDSLDCTVATGARSAINVAVSPAAGGADFRFGGNTFHSISTASPRAWKAMSLDLNGSGSGPVEVDVDNNTFDGWSSGAIEATVGDDEDGRLGVRGNRFSRNGQSVSPVIEMLLGHASGPGASLVATIVGNDFRNNDDSAIWAQRVHSGDTFAGSVISGNTLRDDPVILLGVSGDRSFEGWAIAGNSAPFVGVSNDFVPNQHVVYLLGSVTYGQVACLSTSTADTVAACATVADATLAIGISNGSGGVVTNGYVYGALCSGSISLGDMLMRSDSVAGALKTASSPGIGEVVGRAVSTCSSSMVNLIVGR